MYTNGERKDLLEQTADALFDIDVDALREAGLGWIAHKIDEAYYEIMSTLNVYTFDDETEE